MEIFKLCNFYKQPQFNSLGLRLFKIFKTFLQDYKNRFIYSTLKLINN